MPYDRVERVGSGVVAGGAPHMDEERAADRRRPERQAGHADGPDALPAGGGNAVPVGVGGSASSDPRVAVVGMWVS